MLDRGWIFAALFAAATSRKIALGFWGHVAQQKVTAPIAGETRFHGNSLGLDYQVPDHLHWTTELAGRPDGVDNRFNAYAIYNF
ncbi:MAG TPA: hypothetical protein VIL97_07675 [Thermoanaerobaculia bacterium]